MKKNWIEEHPVEAVIFIFSLCLIIFAGFVLSPWYLPDYGNTIAIGFPARWHEVVIGSYFLISSIPGLVAPFNRKIPNVWLEWGTFGMFLSFLFLTILRVTLYGWIPLNWLNLLGVSLASGVLRLYLRSHRK